ncbi:transposase [Pseudonocardia sp. ICBG1293]|uniref:transposase n=1 Tax=Pseudonocardia sp. ICBG1293 TaxID=2844382 RepID=UPI001CC8F04C|nr:transposase [Pseudonocardia sp. ICBG1293]
MSDPALTGVTRQHLGDLVVELFESWAAQREGRLHDRRGGGRRRVSGAGRKSGIGFCDRLLVSLISLRMDLPQAVLEVLFGVDQATICRVVGEVRPLLAARGYAVSDRPGVRLQTLADALAYAQHEGAVLRLDAHRPCWRAFGSGKKNLHTIKTTIVSDGAGRTLWIGVFRPGRQHDQTAIRREGIDALLDEFSRVRALADAGYRGLRRDHPGQVIVPPLEARKNVAVPTVTAAIRARARTRQSAQRITVEHAIAAHKQWRGLRRWTHRREDLPATYHAVAGLVSDRDVMR